jgi:prepilin-type N-terminal cleavage/methylation domain-containing protein
MNNVNCESHDLSVSERGFSLLELIVVLSIGSILASVSIFYLSGHQRLYKPDEQALKLVDLLQEARQRSLTQRENMRVEIDLTDRVARLIDENGTSVAGDDVEIRTIELFDEGFVKTGTTPPDIATAPNESLSVPTAQFKASNYPPSITNSVCTFRFMKTGTVMNEGTNAIGDNAVVTGATLYLWSPKIDNPDASEVARAITLVGSTGSIRLWEYNRSLDQSNKWQDSRRTGVFGGQAAPAAE